MCTHTHTKTILLLTPKYPHSKRVDTKQLKILPSLMSGILWVQLLSPGAASASLCQRNNNPHSQSHSITLFTNGGAVNEGLAPHHNRLIASMVLIQTTFREILCKSLNCGQMQLKRGQFHCLWHITALLNQTPHFWCWMTVLQHQHHHRTASHSFPPWSCSFFSLSSSRSHQSMLCSPAPWWTCSLSSIRALKSSANWSAPTLRLLATIWKDLPRWLSNALT